MDSEWYNNRHKSAVASNIYYKSLAIRPRERPSPTKINCQHMDMQAHFNTQIDQSHVM